MENEPEKVETNNDSDKPKKVSENSKETEEKKDLPNGESESLEAPVNTSVDSSTDTIIPNGDLIIAKDNNEKNM